MTFAAVLVCLLSQTDKVDKPTVELYQGAFVVRRGSDLDRLPVTIPAKAPPLSVLFRRDKTYVVWDERGLTIRVKEKVFSTRLPELGVSPKLFPREEIKRNLTRFAKSERQKEANALGGARRIGNYVYLLPRWTDKSGTPWLEALVAVDLTSSNPKPKLLGKFEGFTLAKKPIDEQLFLQDMKLSAILQKEDNWGLGTYSVEEGAFDFTTLGDRLRQFLPLHWPQVRFVEETAYGTTVAGETNLLTAERKDLADNRGAMRFIDAEDPPLITMQTVGKNSLRNILTDTEVRLPEDYGVRRGKIGVLVWQPAKEPKSATLYSPDDWKTMATWSATAPNVSRSGQSD